jgi:flagellar protein FliS
MLGSQVATRYNRSSFTTVSKEKLLLMLFDGAIGYARVSTKRLQDGDTVGFREYLGKCQDIVTEFLNTLNMKEGGEIAASLQQIYIFLLGHMNEANVRQDGRNMEDVARILSTLREGFDGAIRSLNAPPPRSG